MHDTREHTASYYAATANWRTDYPRLEGTVDTDVAVVGGGFTGISAALRLIERGYSVAIVEANRIGWGASGRNGDQLLDGFVDTAKIEKRLGARAARIAWDMGIECRDLVLDAIDRYRIDCDLRFGYLDLALNAGDAKKFRATIEKKRALDYPHALEFVPQSELPRYIGSSRYVAGLINRGNGHLHPLNLCLGEARAAEQQGAAIFEQSEVVTIRHGAKPEVHTAHGRVRADRVVLAGNAYLGGTEPKIAGTVIPAGSYIIATEKLSESLAKELLPENMAACDQRVGLDYFRLSADRRMLFGGLCNYSGRHPKNITAVLRPKLLDVFPQLAEARIDYEWGGYIAISINRIPQFGRLQGNTYYAQGFSGHGLAPSHMAGAILADAIAGDSERFDIFARIGHLRLPGGRWFANPALALGMMYYRLKEVL